MVVILLQELAHNTGHESRLGRFAAASDHKFGGEDYSKEELIAESGNAMSCAVSAISSERTLANAAAYIENWLQALRNDRAMLVHAPQAAQKAADSILGSYSKEAEDFSSAYPDEPMSLMVAG